jgi:hypothetical protein
VLRRVSVVNLVRLGFFGLAVLLLALAWLAVRQNHAIRTHLDNKSSFVQPVRAALQHVQLLLMQSGQEFEKHTRRDRVAADDGLHLLRRLAAIEDQLVSNLKPEEASAKIARRPARKALLAYISYIEADSQDAHDETATLLSRQVSHNLALLRTALSERAASFHKTAGRSQDRDFKRMTNLLGTAEIVLSRYFNRLRMDFSLIMACIEALPCGAVFLQGYR